MTLRKKILVGVVAIAGTIGLGLAGAVYAGDRGPLVCDMRGASHGVPGARHCYHEHD